MNDGTTKKIFLASIRPPRSVSSFIATLFYLLIFRWNIIAVVDRIVEEKGSEVERKKGFRPLYDIPWMYEAREFLRKKLIGKKAEVTVDYVQPASEKFPEKTCCTVVFGGM